jgi:hypothetical protein
MHLHVVTTIRNAGAGICGMCREFKSKRVRVGMQSIGHEQKWKVCLDCCQSPGVKLGAEYDLEDPLVTAGIRANRARSKRGEKRTARDIGGRTTAGSGSVHQDGDVVTDDWMIEEKRWSHRTLRYIDKVLLDKVSAQAGKQHKSWALKIRLPLIGYDLAIMLWDDAIGLIRGT